MYQYKSPVGTFWIKPQPGKPGFFLLGIDDEALGSYGSAVSAADDVACHATGFHDWDRRGGVDFPSDLSEWERL